VAVSQSSKIYPGVWEGEADRGRAVGDSEPAPKDEGAGAGVGVRTGAEWTLTSSEAEMR
jgi:hypothetical protein